MKTLKNIQAPLIMDNNKLFKALVNSQSLMKSELLGEIGKLRKETEKGFKEVNTKMDKGFKEVNNRVDLLGKQLNVIRKSILRYSLIQI